MTADQPPLAMTMGDPAGIGPELALAAWRARTQGEAPFFLLASPAYLSGVAKRLGFEAPIIEIEPARAASVVDRGLPVVPIEAEVDAEPGRPDSRNASATLEFDRARRPGGQAGRGARCRHQSDRQAAAL